MLVTVHCPHCRCYIKADESLDGKQVNCPGCKRRMRIRIDPALDETIQSGDLLLLPDDERDLRHDETVEDKPGLAGTKRFLSLPWLVLIFIFGFLPWSEVGCASREFNWRVGQSGYQALYGGISSPFDSLDVAKNAALKDAGANKQALSKNIETERSDFLMACSPFVVLFWVAALAALLYVCLTPLGGARLAVCLALAGLMALMMVITLVVGTPLERRVELAVHEAIRTDPDSALMMMGAITSGKTVWFWLALVAVLLVAATEAVSNLLWRSFELVRSVVLVGIASGALVLAVAGVGTQAVLWQAGLTAMESRLAQLHQAEQEKVQKAEEAGNARREQERQAEEKRQAALRKQREDYESRQKALEQEGEQQRLEAERLRLEKERKDRELQEEREREAKEQAKQKAEEAERRRLEEMKKEAESKAKRERDEKEAREPLKLAKKLLEEDDVYRNDNAAEARPILEKIIKDWPGTEAAAEAKRLLPPVKSAGAEKRAGSEEDTGERLSYAKKLIDKGNAAEARTRLEKIAKEWPRTNAAKEARMLLKELGK